MRTYLACALVLFASLMTAPALAGDDQDAYNLVLVHSRSAQDVMKLQALGLDLVKVRPDFSAESVVLDGQLPGLDRTGLSYEVLIRDMETYFADRLAKAPKDKRGFPDGSMGGYYTFTEVVDLLDQWALQYPNLITPKISLGKSIQGRDIWAVKISDNPNQDENEPESSFDALIHAREPQGMMTLVYYMMNLLEQYGTDPELTYLVDNREIWFIPVHNPDGYVYNQQNSPGGGGMWRKNRRDNGGGVYGVDLARNYGFNWGYDNYGSSPNPSAEDYRGTAAFSEPESQALRDHIALRPIATSWNTHTYGNYYLCPFGYDNVLPYGDDWPIYQEWLADISAENGYPTGNVYQMLNYLANGAPVDWHYAVAGSYCISPEIGNSGDYFWPDFDRILPLAVENFMPVKYWTWIAGSYVTLQGHALADDNGDGVFHPGEPVDVTLTLRNKGLQDTAASVTAVITSQSPYVTVVNGTHDFGTIPGVTSADNSQSPLTVKLAGATPYGETVTLDVAITFDGYTLSLPLDIKCGVPNLLYAFDMETDPGWTVGDTGDNATYGIWERDDPIGTSSGGQQIQPEDDHTPAPGTQCFVTGNNSSTAGGDDVDNGKTTLKTAVMNLNGISGAEISYWRWYADLGSAPNNDIFQVDISNDGGASWTNVESLDHTENAWNQVTFDVAGYVTPTANMMMRFIARDEPNDSLCEACIDDFEVRTYNAPVQLGLSGAPAVGTTVNVVIDSPNDAGLPYVMAASLATYPGIPLAGGDLFPLSYDLLTRMSLNPANGIFVNFNGVLDGAGHTADPAFVIPGMPGIVGLELFFAAVTVDGGAVKNISAPLSVVLQ